MSPISEPRQHYRSAYVRYGLIGLACAMVLLFLFGLFRYGASVLVSLLPFFMAIIIAYILNPLVEFLESRRVPRYLGILAIYAVFFSLLFFIGFTTIPTLLNELQKLADRVPEYTRRFQLFILHMQSDYRRVNIPESVRLVLDQNIISLQEGVQDVLERVTGTVLGMFSHLFTILITPLLVYYILRDMDTLKRSFVMLFPRSYRMWVAAMGSEMDRTLGAYFRGMLLICFLVALMAYTGFIIIGIDFALILAIIAGITNIIPYFGPLIGAVPAVLLAALNSPGLVIKVILVIIIVQQVESQLIAPQILGRSLGLHPLVVIFVLIVGGKFFGLAGLIFAVPLTAMLRIFLKHAVDLAANRR
ncbi:MAG: AI-2E family transporter [Bacillota bacterium]|nr:AI-2E family transporter [Bacillota bacterium]MDW7683261.1 AI-2E family transporter [Bacillota bacterium]